MATAKRKKTTRSRKKTVRKTRRAKPKRKATTGKKSAGLIRVSFKGHRVSAEKIFGKRPMTPAAVAEKLWNYVSKKGLAYKK